MRLITALVSVPLRRDDGAATVEYAILIMLVAAVIISVVTTIGLRTLDNFQSVLPAFMR